MSTQTAGPAAKDVYALAAAVRAGTLSAAQREQLVALLLQVDTAAAMCGRRCSYPPEEQAWFHALCWDPVVDAYAEVLTNPGRAPSG